MAKQVVVIGGEPSSTYLIRRFAEESGLQVVPDVGPEVWLIIIDVDLEPEWDRINRIKRMCEVEKIPILLCSWQEEIVSAVKEQIPVDQHLLKPFLLDDFQTALQESGVLD